MDAENIVGQKQALETRQGLNPSDAQAMGSDGAPFDPNQMPVLQGVAFPPLPKAFAGLVPPAPMGPPARVPPKAVLPPKAAMGPPPVGDPAPDDEPQLALDVPQVGKGISKGKPKPSPKAKAELVIPLSMADPASEGVRWMQWLMKDCEECSSLERPWSEQTT